MFMRRWALALVFTGFTFPAGAALWQDLAIDAVPDVGLRLIQPEAARYLDLQPDVLLAQLQSAPMEFSGQPPLPFRLPMPDGSEAEFLLRETALMHPELAARYPQIRTWVGQGVTDPNASLRMDWGARGMHAMVLSPQGAVFIDPVQRGDIRHYQSYFLADLRPRGPRVPDQVVSDQPQQGAPASYAGKASFAGEQLRTYRFAVATTGEYGHFHDPQPEPTVIGLADKSIVLAEVVNAINRVVGIYEREFGIRLQIVANNDAAIFQNPLLDPYLDAYYVGFENSLMMLSNTAVLNLLVGPDAYDVGHVLGTNGGGVASLGSVCGNNKGGGQTGLPEPIGDFFYVSYLAHEIGHQFGANHTFNGLERACAGGNRHEATAYEPGSGSTIMSYAGTCLSDDLHWQSDEYFHGISFDEVRAFVEQGGGAACGELMMQDNQPPQADAGRGGHTIPILTPFELVGMASDPDGDAITAHWEQFDLGPQVALGTPTAEGPLFRSYPPTPSSTRIIPRLEDLLVGVSSTHEVLPQVSRELNFRFTVRDNHLVAGGVASAMLKFDVSDTAGPFRVTQPDGHSDLAPGAMMEVRWDVAGTDLAPVACSAVDISLSDDGGYQYPYALSMATANDGVEMVSLPDAMIEAARLKLKCSDNIFFAISPQDFRVGSQQSRASITSRGGVLGLHFLLLTIALAAIRHRRVHLQDA